MNVPTLNYIQEAMEAIDEFLTEPATPERIDKLKEDVQTIRDEYHTLVD
jgi:hypothetical protein